MYARGLFAIPAVIERRMPHAANYPGEAKHVNVSFNQTAKNFRLKLNYYNLLYYGAGAFAAY